MLFDIIVICQFRNSVVAEFVLFALNIYHFATVKIK